MGKGIFIIGGGWLGCWSSLVTMAIVDYLMEAGESVYLVEGDTSDPNVWEVYKDVTETSLICLDDADGWIHLVNECARRPESVVVVNTHQRANLGYDAYVATLGSTLGELKRRLVTMWVIDQRDMLGGVKQYMDAVPHSEVHVVRRSPSGDESEFWLYNGSKVRRLVEERGGESLTFPALSDLVSDGIYSERLSIANALKWMSAGSRAELMRWRCEFKRVFEGVIGGQGKDWTVQ